MNLLVIVYNIGGSAGGIVIEELLKELLKRNVDTKIICNKNKSLLTGGNLYEIGEENLGITDIWKINLILRGRDLSGSIWVNKGLEAFESFYKEFKPDIIFCIASAYGFRTFQLAYRIWRKYKIPYILHALDPIPSTPEWGENYFLRKAILRHIKPFYKNATIVSATNESMINYQLDLLKINNTKNKMVLYNPVLSKKTDEDLTILSNVFKILYLGTLYEKRNPQSIINAFSHLDHINNNYKLLFVGRTDHINIGIPDVIKAKIEFIPWTDEPGKYIYQSKLLLDIDADIKNYVFISSKLIQYLIYKKPILCISPINSPARQLLNSCKKTIFFSVNEEKSIYNNLLRIVNTNFTDSDYNERDDIIVKLKPESIIDNLFAKIAQKVKWN